MSDLNNNEKETAAMSDYEEPTTSNQAKRYHDALCSTPGVAMPVSVLRHLRDVLTQPRKPKRVRRLLLIIRVLVRHRSRSAKPIVVWPTDGGRYEVVDGFHRIRQQGKAARLRLMPDP